MGDGKKKPDTGPSPAVAVYAGAATLLVLAGAAVLGTPIAAGACAGLVAVADFGLLRRRHQTLTSWESRYPERERALRPHAATSLWIIAIALFTLGAGVIVFRHDITPNLAGHRVWPYRGMAFTLAGTAAITHISALVDYAYILLRLYGLAGDDQLPCQHPSGWSGLTQLWLGHRLAAHIAVRVGLIALIGFGAVLVAPRPDHSRPRVVTTFTTTTPARAATSGSRTTPASQTTATSTEDADSSKDKTSVTGVLTAVLVPLIAALLVAFLNRFIPLGAIVMNPRLSVGDRIVLAEEFHTRSAHPPEYYVVDIAMEGVKLLELDESGDPKGLLRNGPGRAHDRSIDLLDIPRLLRYRGQFHGCATNCSKANHNCRLRYGQEILEPEEPSEPDVPEETS